MPADLKNYSNTVKDIGHETKHLAQKLIFLKERNHMTTRMLSERTGVPVGTLNKIISGATDNPSVRVMEKIADAFGVPIIYFVDRSIHRDCEIGVFADSRHLMNISRREQELVFGFRSLAERGKKMVEDMVKTYGSGADVLEDGESSKRIYCYIPFSIGKGGVVTGSMEIKQILIHNDEVAKASDFAVVLVGDAMEPLFSSGTILGFKRVEVHTGNIGAFVYKDRGYIRRLMIGRGEKRLDTINRHVPNVVVHDPAALQCLGVVVGVLTLVES